MEPKSGLRLGCAREGCIVSCWPGLAPAKLPNKNKQVYAELVCIAEESDTTTHLRVKHWAHVGMGMISGEKTGRLSSLEIVMSWRQVDRAVFPRDCLEEQIWHYLSTAKGKVGKEEGVRY